MKKSLLLTLATLLTFYSLSAQMQITGSVFGLEASYVFVEQPFNGKYFPMEKQRVEGTPEGDFVIEVESRKPGFVTILLPSGGSFRMFVEPGKESAFEVDASNWKSTLEFTGASKSQNEFLQKLERFDLNEVAGMRAKFYSTAAKDFYLNVTDHKEAELKILAKRGKKRFSQTFMRAMTADIKNYYAGIFTAIAHDEWKLREQGKSTNFNEKWGKYWDQILHEPAYLDVNSAVTPYFLYFLEHYIVDYRLGLKQENDYLDADVAAGEHYLEYDRLMWKYFEGDVREYAIAAILSKAAIKYNGKPYLMDLLQKFKNDYPNSQYLTQINSFLEKAVEAEAALVKDDFGNGYVNLGDNTDLQSLSEVISKLEGKVIYLDIWATWCAPCVSEFRHFDKLEDFAAGRDDVALLFISVDEQDRDEKWRAMIRDNELRGYHILSNYALRDDLINQFGDGSTLALPKYLIYDKQGNLVVEGARKPSDRHLTVQQIERYLQRN